MMKKNLCCSRLGIALLLLLQVSCASVYGPSGTPYNTDKTYLIVRGMSAEEVLEIMDSPPHERLVLDGRETWIWVFSDNDTTRSFSVSLFDKKVEDTFTFRE